MKRSILRKLVLLPLGLAALSSPAFGLGHFAGIIGTDAAGGCAISAPRDAEGVTCSLDRHEKHKVVRVTLTYERFRLKNPPVCTFTGMTIPKCTLLGSIGYHPFIDELWETYATVVLEKVTSVCREQPIMTFSCAISD